MKDWKALPETLRSVNAVWIWARLPGLRGGTLSHERGVFLVILREQSVRTHPLTDVEAGLKAMVEATGHRLHFALDESDVLALIRIEG